MSLEEGLLYRKKHGKKLNARIVYNAIILKYYVPEVFEMSEKENNWSKKRVNRSVNPQGLTEDEAEQRPKSQLEQRAKKKNTKI